MTFFRRRKEELLFRAVETDDHVKAHELLEQGGLEWRNPEWHYSTPMHMCGRSNAFKCLKELLCAKADVDARDKEGMTVLQLAAQHQSNDVVDLLQRRALKYPPEAQLFECARAGGANESCDARGRAGWLVGWFVRAPRASKVVVAGLPSSPRWCLSFVDLVVLSCC